MSIFNTTMILKYCSFLQILPTCNTVHFDFGNYGIWERASYGKLICKINVNIITYHFENHRLACWKNTSDSFCSKKSSSLCLTW